MPISIQGYTSGDNTDFSHEHPAGLVNDVLIVCIGTHQGVITGITYGGQAMTQLALGSSAFDEDGSIWILLDPPTGSNTVDITRSGGSWHGASALSLAGVKQTTTGHTKVEVGSSGSSASSSIVAPSLQALIVAVIGTEAGVSAGSILPGGSNLFGNEQGQSFENFGAIFGFNGTTPTKTVTFNLSSGQRYGFAVVVLEQAVAGAEFSGYKHIEVGNGMSRSESAT